MLLMVLGFFAAAKQTKKFELGQNLKLVVVAFVPMCMLTMCFLEKKFKFWFVCERLKIVVRANFYSKH